MGLAVSLKPVKRSTSKLWFIQVRPASFRTISLTLSTPMKESPDGHIMVCREFRLISVTAQAESLVLASNRSSSYPSLLTCSLRPAGIFGEGDLQMIPNMLKVYENSKTGFQLGDNSNLFDFTYVGNVAQAHCLAAAALRATSQLSTTPLSHEKVDGEVFFITNDQPIYFWDFARAVWKAAGNDKGTEHVWEISQTMGMLIGGTMEYTLWLLGKEPSLTRRQVRYSCMTRYYDCGKAKRLLGYKPEVHLWEGIKRSVAWFKNENKPRKTE